MPSLKNMDQRQLSQFIRNVNSLCEMLKDKITSYPVTISASKDERIQIRGQTEFAVHLDELSIFQVETIIQNSAKKEGNNG